MESTKNDLIFVSLKLNKKQMRLESKMYQKSNSKAHECVGLWSVGVLGTPFGLWNIDEAIFW